MINPFLYDQSISESVGKGFSKVTERVVQKWTEVYGHFEPHITIMRTKFEFGRGTQKIDSVSNTSQNL